ncbi:hypothetical protein TELCIR_04437 [Teladorsagia circumcincta]|uniref:Uncharacterized protein n=1 Tax=Teladorsagia circumcincta TaxID=45464 RepID=A0A2G9UTV8_TELCI|nr:hypothetical protein TELCIR_04437 [Teladorsagia circumcincta]
MDGKDDCLHPRLDIYDILSEMAHCMETASSLELIEGSSVPVPVPEKNSRNLNISTLDPHYRCISACSLREMRECQCDAEEDNYCYLCCGNANHQCLPAHHHNILRTNGERWEREACSRCRMHGAHLEGLPCDDTDPARLCITGRMEKICVDNSCENPCARFAPHLMVCDCPAIDQDTGFASDDRCQLCCYDFNLKPTNRRCQNAYRKYKVMDLFQKPIWRVGLECAGGKTCNKYGGIFCEEKPQRESTMSSD